MYIEQSVMSSRVVLSKHTYDVIISEWCTNYFRLTLYSNYQHWNGREEAIHPHSYTYYTLMCKNMPWRISSAGVIETYIQFILLVLMDYWSLWEHADFTWNIFTKHNNNSKSNISRSICFDKVVAQGVSHFFSS